VSKLEAYILFYRLRCPPSKHKEREDIRKMVESGGSEPQVSRNTLHSASGWEVLSLSKFSILNREALTLNPRQSKPAILETIHSEHLNLEKIQTPKPETLNP